MTRSEKSGSESQIVCNRYLKNEGQTDWLKVTAGLMARGDDDQVEWKMNFDRVRWRQT